MIAYNWVGWQETIRGLRYVRSDGAVVKWDQSSPHPNPANASARMWTAWEPDPSQKYLAMSRSSSRLNWPRRFKSAGAAMCAVDKEFPLQAAAA